MSDVQPVLIDGEWRAAHTEGTFEPHNPTAQSPTGEVYPVSSLNDVEAVVRAGSVAAEEMAGLVPDLTSAGAQIIGGCCGTTPDHIRAFRQTVDQNGH